jgi:hypothetical protein
MELTIEVLQSRANFRDLMLVQGQSVILLRLEIARFPDKTTLDLRGPRERTGDMAG